MSDSQIYGGDYGFKLTVKGIDGAIADLEEIKLRVDEAMFAFVVKGLEEVNKRAKAVFIGGGDSNLVDTWRSDAWPLPTRRSGFLMNSIRSSKPVHIAPGTWGGQTGPRTVYGRRIELGYKGTGKWPYFTTRAFPFLKPGVADAMPAISAMYYEFLSDATGFLDSTGGS